MADLARHLDRSVEVSARRPGERERSLGPLEAARIGRRSGLLDARIFAARRRLYGDGARDLLAEGQDRLVPILGHAAGSGREGHGHEISAGGEPEQAGRAIEAVERGLARQLPVGGKHPPAIFEATDALADAIGLGKAVAARQRTIVETVDHAAFELVALVAFQPDQFHPAGSEGEFDIAADLVFRPALARIGDAIAPGAEQRCGGFRRFLEKEILAVFQIEIGEHAVGEFVGEAGRQLRIVEAAGKLGRLGLDQIAATIGNEDVAIRAEALIAVAERDGVIERAALAGQRDFAAV